MRTIFDRILPVHAQGATLVSLTLILIATSLGQNAYAQPAESARFQFSQIASKIQGQVVFSNQSIVANAAVYVADTKAMSLFDTKAKKLNSPQFSAKGDSTVAGANSQAFKLSDFSACGKPNVAVLSFTCSDENGYFTLSLPSVPTLPLVITISKNSQTINISLGLDDLGSDIGQVALDASQTEDALDRVAIVENITPYIKSRLPENGHNAQNTNELAMDSEFLTAYGLDILQSNVEYPGYSTLFHDADNDGRLDIFNYSTVLLKTSWKTSLSNMDTKTRQILLEYVEKGGQLLITNKPQPEPQNQIEGFI